MKCLPLGIISLLWVILLSKSLAFGENPIPFTREQSVINTFQVMCQLETLSFDRLNERATLMRMVLLDSKKAASIQNTFTRSKSWAGGLGSGPFVFLLDEMSGAKGVTTSCAVLADVPDVDSFRTEALKELNLKNLPAPELGSDGSRSYLWVKPYGEGSTLIIRNLKQSGRPGVMIKLLVMRQSADLGTKDRPY